MNPTILDPAPVLPLATDAPRHTETSPEHDRGQSRRLGASDLCDLLAAPEAAPYDNGRAALRRRPDFCHLGDNTFPDPTTEPAHGLLAPNPSRNQELIIPGVQGRLDSASAPPASHPDAGGPSTSPGRAVLRRRPDISGLGDNSPKDTSRINFGDDLFPAEVSGTSVPANAPPARDTSFDDPFSGILFPAEVSRRGAETQPETLATELAPRAGGATAGTLVPAPRAAASDPHTPSPSPTPSAAPSAPPPPALKVRFAQIAGTAASRKVLLRQAAVQTYNLALATSGDQLGRETIKAAVIQQFTELARAAAYRVATGSTTPEDLASSQFKISRRSLQRWIADYQTDGLDGLVEQKKGIVGRKGLVIPEHLRAYARAGTLENGSIAAAAHKLMRHPELPAEIREHLHEGHASGGSYVTPSLRDQLRVSPLTAALAQGPKAARLEGAYTGRDWSDVKAGQVYCSDDMTANGVAWCKTPHTPGWRLGQPQLLPVYDCGSRKWLNFRLILRENGQYNSDDAWGLFGDVFDVFGLPQIFILEGGIWRANKIIGARSGISHDDRTGGLAALGIKVIHSHDPRNKPIEGAFHPLQNLIDSYPGWTGRDARKQLPEITQQRIARCRSGKAHPSEYFPEMTQYADHVATGMAQLNDTRQDGKILRGMSPNEKWIADAPVPRVIRDDAKWLYRSALSVNIVTRNGVRVTQGSGAGQHVYYYDNPALLVPRQGTRVRIYWNDTNPDADAILLDNHTGAYIGAAQRKRDIGAFSASPTELEAEAKRKAARLGFARVELRSIQPELRRTAVPITPDAAAQRIGAAIDDSARQAALAIEREAILRECGNAPTPSPEAISDLATISAAPPTPEDDLETLLASLQRQRI